MSKHYAAFVAILCLMVFVASDWYKAATAIQTVVLLVLIVSGMVLLGFMAQEKRQK